jgi:tetratricopeptide (TPR) repeat protein
MSEILEFFDIIFRNIVDFNKHFDNLSTPPSTYWSKKAKDLYRTDYVHQRLRTVRKNLKIAHAKDLISSGRRRYSREAYYRKLSQYKINLEKAKKANDVRNIGRLYYNIASVLKTSGHMDAALSYYTESLKVFQEIRDPKQEARTLGNMGVVSAGMEQMDEALEHFMGALSIHRVIGSPEDMAIVLINIGLVHRIRGDMLDALKYLNWALNECELYNLKGYKKTIVRAIEGIEESLP